MTRPPLQLRSREKRTRSVGGGEKKKKKRGLDTSADARKSRVWQYDSRNLETRSTSESSSSARHARTFEFPIESVSRARSSRTTEIERHGDSTNGKRVAREFIGLIGGSFFSVLFSFGYLSDFAGRWNRSTSRFGTGAFVLRGFSCSLSFFFFSSLALVSFLYVMYSGL